MAAGLISEQQLRRALELQESGGAALGQVLMAEGWVRPLDFYSLLAEQYGLPFVNLVEQPPDPALFDAARLDDYARRQYVPWRRREGTLQIAVTEVGEDAFAALKAEYGPETEFVVTSRLDILWTVQRLAHDALVADAIYGRARRDPVHSARTVLDQRQKVAGGVLLIALVAAVLWKGLAALIVLHALIIAALAGSFL
ncbi:MAG: glycosyltransferase, partial [Bryobacteraceae bacterium]